MFLASESGANEGKAQESSHHSKSFLILKYSLFGSVKLRIKSFKVPELFIEILETATVGSLKVSKIIRCCIV